MAGSRRNSKGHERRPTGILDRVLTKRVQALAEVRASADLITMSVTCYVLVHVPTPCKSSLALAFDKSGTAHR